MGNPHMIYFAKNLDDIDLAKLGPDLEHHPLFPQRCNVEMVQIIDDHRLAMRVWERGTGLTLACGTGACAVVAAYLLTKRSDLYGHWIHVDMPGGSLRIQWDNIEGDMWMAGPTQQVAQGILDASFVK
jgi:diaminopimelate epimerase